MKARWFVVLWCPSLAWAADVVRCDPSDATVPNRVVRYERSANTQAAWLIDPTYLLNPSPLPAGDVRHWKCQGQAVVAMTPAEQAALDAPLVAEETRQQAFTAQLTDSLCSAELADLDTQIDAAFSSVSTLSQLKSTATSILKRLAKCVRARAR